MKPLIEVQSLKKYFPLQAGVFSAGTTSVKAVEDVSFFINKGETLGLVGESGCGKTTLGRMTIRLIEPTAGKILFAGKDILTMDKKSLATLRPRMQIIFQDPYSSLNPRFTVERLIGEAMLVHSLANSDNLKEKVGIIMEKVGLSSRYLKRYPHEFSGGQRQRIGIARALALNPQYIVCDEPVSALDVSIQAQIINLLQELQSESEITMLFISHDLNVVKYLSNRTAVMYLGKIIEIAPTGKLHKDPLHPYTKALLSAQPSLDPKRKVERIVLGGDVPSPMNPPSGCHFHPRCPEAIEKCKTEVPEMIQIDKDHSVHCHLYNI
jgi:oligopeptide/dipeptide ABC transporter ATP-binding protein